MGRAKLLLPWGRHTIFEQVLNAWRDSRVTATIVVVHPDDHELAEVVRRSGVHVVVAPTPPPDMKASVLLGLEYVAKHFGPMAFDAWMIAPADLPLLESRTIDAVLAARNPADKTIVVPTDGNGKRSHPVLFPWPLIEELPHLGPDRGLKELTERHVVQDVSIPWLVASADVDTPDDYRHLYDRYHQTDK